MTFQAGGESCGVCQALDGTEATPPAHENCTCVDTATDGCTVEADSAGETDRHGDGPYDATIFVDIIVTCPDGSPSGAVTEAFDVSGYDGSGDFSDYVDGLIDAVADEMCNCQPFANV